MTNTGQEQRLVGGAASMRPSSQRSTVVRMNLFVLVRILFQYLERVDPSSLDLAKEVLKDCERKHNTKDSKYETLADAINERVRDCVGESHWAQARKIQKQLMVNQQRKKLKAMKGSKLSGKAKFSSSSSQRPRPPSLTLAASAAGSSASASASGASDEAMEAAETMSALARANPPDRDLNATPPRSNKNSRFKSLNSVDEDMTDSSGFAMDQIQKQPK